MLGLKSVLLVVGLLLFSVVGWLSQARQTEPESAYIAFISNRDGQRDIYRMWADGSHVQRLTNTPANEFDLAWSPDGQTIAFTETLQTNRLFFQIKALNPTTYDVHLLSTAISDYNGLHWSPDGSQILFAAQYAGPGEQVYALTLGENIPRKIMDWDTQTTDPHYSPNGSQLLFTSTYNASPGATNLFIMQLDSQKIQQLTAGIAYIRQPTWSPDGSAIIYERYREGKSELFKLTLGEEESQHLLASENYVLNPAWSPDGKWVLFDANPYGNFEIFRMRPDGTQQENLTRSLGEDQIPTWSPVIDKAWHPQRLFIGGALLLIGLIAVLLGQRFIYPSTPQV